MIKKTQGIVEENVLLQTTTVTVGTLDQNVVIGPKRSSTPTQIT
jgi:hypothetical protein